MWYNQFISWQKVKRISKATVLATLAMLFFASFFPYTTGIMATHFFNVTAQTMYGIIVLLVSFSTILISYTIDVASGVPDHHLLYDMSNRLVIIDLIVKFMGMILTLTVYPPAISYTVFVDIILLFVAQLFIGKGKLSKS